ncbi:MAG: phospholipase D family protein [Polyangiaceae bacterium]|nr:phospholipase D family protein [Polyangiaceae bacterium]
MTAASSPNTTDDEAFVVQCEADYTIAEITAVAHVAPRATAPTHVLAVVELLHKHLEPNPLISLAPKSGGYPRGIDLGTRGGKLLVQRWHVSVGDGIQWYRTCARGSMTVPGRDPLKPTVVQLGQLGDDPPWPHLVIEVEQFWPYSEFWGDRPGGSRWHRLVPVAPIDVTHGWETTDFEHARNFFMSEVHVDILSRSVLVGSCHLRLPNPIYRDLQQRVGSDWRSVTFDVDPYPTQPLNELELMFWNQRSWGATSVRRMTLQPGVNVLHVPEGVEQVAHAVVCQKRGLLKLSQSAGFIRAFNGAMDLISEQRSVEAPKGRYTVGVSGASQPIQVGTPRPAGALTRLAADEGQQRTQREWAATAFQWFDKDGVAGTQAIRDIIRSASTSVDLLDSYFGRGDLMEFALSTTKHGLPFRVLTSHDFCTSGEDPDLKIERGDALAKTLESVRAEDPRLNIEIKVMPGQKSPVHDRFLIVDGTVWVLGASLNEFGSRGSLLMKLPASPVHGTSGSSAFSVSANVFDVHWDTSDALADWVKRRAASRTGSRGASRPGTLKERVLSTKRMLEETLQRVHEVWRA